MTHRHSPRTLAFQERRFASPDRASEGRQDSALYERVSREELREIVNQQRLHFLLLERAMKHLSSEVRDAGEVRDADEVPEADEEDRPTIPVPSLPSPTVRTALQHDLEAILLAELCDESELDSSMEIASPDSTRGPNGTAS